MSTELTPAGKYLAKAREWTITKAKTGTLQAFVNFAFEDGSGTIGAFFALTPKAFDNSMKALTRCGYEGVDPINDLERTDAGLDKNVVELVVEHEEYEGKTRAKVKWVNLPGAGFKPLDPADKASFAEEMKARALAFRQSQPPQTGPGKQVSGGSAGVHPADAEIPF